MASLLRIRTSWKSGVKVMEQYMEMSGELELNGRDLASMYVFHPLDHVVPNFRVTEFTEVFRGTPEKMEKTRGSCRWVHYGRCTNWSYYT